MEMADGNASFPLSAENLMAVPPIIVEVLQ